MKNTSKTITPTPSPPPKKKKKWEKMKKETRRRNAEQMGKIESGKNLQDSSTISSELDLKQKKMNDEVLSTDQIILYRVCTQKRRLESSHQSARSAAHLLFDVPTPANHNGLLRVTCPCDIL